MLLGFTFAPAPAGKDLDDSWSGSLDKDCLVSGAHKAAPGDSGWPTSGLTEGGERREGKEGGGGGRRRQRHLGGGGAALADCSLVGSGIFGLSDELRIQDVPVTSSE